MSDLCDTGSDTTPPIVEISAPKPDDVVTRNSQVIITVTAGDDSGAIPEVSVFVNNAPVCPRLLTPPFRCTWHVPAKPGRPYALQASARDPAGNVKLSAIVRVKSSAPNAPAVRSAPKGISAPRAGRTPWGTPAW